MMVENDLIASLVLLKREVAHLCAGRDPHVVGTRHHDRPGRLGAMRRLQRLQVVDLALTHAPAVVEEDLQRPAVVKHRLDRIERGLRGGQRVGVRVIRIGGERDVPHRPRAPIAERDDRRVGVRVPAGTSG